MKYLESIYNIKTALVRYTRLALHQPPPHPHPHTHTHPARILIPISSLPSVHASFNKFLSNRFYLIIAINYPPITLDRINCYYGNNSICLL